MADAAVSFLLENLGELVERQIVEDSVAIWIQKEMKKLKPELESADAVLEVSKEMEDLIGIVGKAEVLVQIYIKRIIESKGTNVQRLFLPFREWRLTNQLNEVKYKIVKARDNLLNSPQQQQIGMQQQQEGVPAYLRRLQQYFHQFPPNYKVPKRRLLALWVAEGLVQSNQNDGHESAEQAAERYLKELIDLKVVVVEMGRSGGVKSCMMYVATPEAAESKKPNSLQQSNGKIRRLVDSNGSNGANFIQIQGHPRNSKSLRDYKEVVSFVSFNTQEGSQPGEEIGDFLRKCISAGCFEWLKVLDLERVFRPKLPDTLGKLIALKYIGLRWTYLENLPDTINKLLNLQVLDMKHTYISVLPGSIWSMEYLRHLYLSEAYRTRFPDPPSKVTLTALQTLWGAFVDEETRVAGGLDTLLNIRKLGLSCRLVAFEPERDQALEEKRMAIERWISKLNHLESLRLKSRDDNGDATHLQLTSLEGNKNLSTLYLLGKLVPSLVCELPVSLTDITLSGSALPLDPMRFLARLPNLMILRLLAKSVVCNTIHCSNRGFPKLKLLWLWKLEELVLFQADKGSLPCLEELEIRSCDKLGTLPDLLHVRNLEIKLTTMPPHFLQKASAKYSKVEHVAKDDRYILSNTSGFPHQKEDLLSACFAAYQRSSSRNCTATSMF